DICRFEPDWLNGMPLATYTVPEMLFGLDHWPPGMTIHNGLLPPAVPVTRGSYVYQTAKTWLLPACWAKLTPQPDSLGFHQRSVKFVAGVAWAAAESTAAVAIVARMRSVMAGCPVATIVGEEPSKLKHGRGDFAARVISSKTL